MSEANATQQSTRQVWNAQLLRAGAAVGSELLQWAESLTVVARDTMLAELSCDTVEAWLKADGWHRRFWNRNGGTEWNKDAGRTGLFVNAITVPDDDDNMDAKRALVVTVARFHPAGMDVVNAADAVLAALLRQQEEFRKGCRGAQE